MKKRSFKNIMQEIVVDFVYIMILISHICCDLLFNPSADKHDRQ